MSLQQRSKEPAALSLPDNCIHLARDGSLSSYAKTPEFFRNAGRSAELMDGRVLALHNVRTPQDVHYPIWEMHPEGDELLILASGSLTVEFREDGAERRVLLPAQAAFIVPAGLWHRLVVHEPSVLIAITPRRNTVHEKA
jgi:mannose-6-phosphate isomerase-like protein (cupin superfamily)